MVESDDNRWPDNGPDSSPEVLGHDADEEDYLAPGAPIKCNYTHSSHSSKIGCLEKALITGGIGCLGMIGVGAGIVALGYRLFK